MAIVGIYGIFDSVTSECLYVGQSKHCEDRFKQHVYKLRGRRSNYLQDFIVWFHENEVNESRLIFTILEECSNDYLLKNVLEAKWFHELSPRFYGKRPSLTHDASHSEETKAKIAEAVSEARRLGKKDLHAHICGYCNAVFTSTKMNRKFCSVDCRSKHQSLVIPFTDEELLSKYHEGLSCRAIARETGLDLHKEIANRLKVLGVSITPKVHKSGITFHQKRCPCCDENFSSRDLRRKFCSRSCARKSRDIGKFG